MADNIELIGAGETHTTIASWEAATDVDLTVGTGTGTREIGELKDAEFAESPIIAGATTEAANYRWLRSASGAEFDHTTKTDGARILNTSAGTYAVQIADTTGFDRFGGSEGASSGSVGLKCANNLYGVYNDGSAAGIISQIVVYDSIHDDGSFYPFFPSASGTTLYNCLAFNCESQSGNCRGFYTGSAANLTAYNCVVYDMVASGTSIGFYRGTVYNCYGGDCSTAFQAGLSGDYNGADDASTSQFGNNLQSKAGGDQFVSVGVGSEDFHLKTGADLIDAGNDAHGNDFDIDGAFAGTRDDIGIHEFVVAAGTQLLEREFPRGVGRGLVRGVA